MGTRKEPRSIFNCSVSPLVRTAEIRTSGLADCGACLAQVKITSARVRTDIPQFFSREYAKRRIDCRCYGEETRRGSWLIFKGFPYLVEPKVSLR